jgi:hypothetical protein
MREANQQQTTDALTRGSLTGERTPEELKQLEVQLLDLCIASYQLYHQSTVFKIDTWNETLVHDSEKYRNEVLPPLRAAVQQGNPSVAKYYPQGNLQAKRTLCTFDYVQQFNGANKLFCFEGITGQKGPGLPGLKSIMGFILWDKEKGRVNIVFRGSRGGDPVRNFKDGLVSSVGNPDWVTDMMFTQQVEDHTISIEGTPCSRFASAFSAPRT